MWAIKNGDSLSIGKHKNAKRQILLEPECRIQFIWHVVKTVPEFNQPHLATDYNIFQNKYMVILLKRMVDLALYPEKNVKFSIFDADSNDNKKF